MIVSVVEFVVDWFFLLLLVMVLRRGGINKGRWGGKAVFVIFASASSV